MTLKPHTEMQFKNYFFSFHKEDVSDIFKVLQSDNCCIGCIV